MTFRNAFPFACHLLVALILGTTLRQQIDLLKYFYATRFIDWVPMLVIFLTGFLLTIKYISEKGTVNIIILLLFLATALYSTQLVFLLHGYIDWANVFIYVLLSVIAATLGVLIKSHGFRLPSIFLVLCSSLAFWIVPTSLIQWLAIAIPVLFCIHEMSQSQWKNTGIWLTASLVLIVVEVWLPDDSIRYKAQQNYYDRVLYSAQTPFHQIDITTWKGHEWFYYDNINQFSSIDYCLYFEPMVHPAIKLASSPEKVLVIGGENGLLVKEVLKHKQIESIDLAPIDTALLNIATELHWFTDLNEHALQSKKVRLKGDNIFRLLASDSSKYDLIFIDVPDPVDLEFSQYYTSEFYDLCAAALKENGLLVTQAGSPYLATLAFYTIQNTIKASGFSTLPLHNQVLTLGEWGWVIGAKGISEVELEQNARQCTFEDIETKWLNHEAMLMIISFGKLPIKIDSSAINTLKKPVINEYYSSGTWTF